MTGYCGVDEGVAGLTAGLRIPRRAVGRWPQTVLGFEISLGSTQKLVEETGEAVITCLLTVARTCVMLLTVRRWWLAPLRDVGSFLL